MKFAIKDLDRLDDERGLAGAKIHDAMTKVFRLGDRARWLRGQFMQTGTILMVSPWERLRVRNHYSNAEVMIDLRNVLAAYGSGYR